MITYTTDGWGTELQTLSVAELQEALKQFSGGIPVFVTWEGQLIPLDLKDLELSNKSFNLTEAVVINADNFK